MAAPAAAAASGGGSNAATAIGVGAQSGLTLSGNIMSAGQARRNREWQERMSNTAHQREVADLIKAGLNPVLSVTGGGEGASTPMPSMPTVHDAGAGTARTISDAALRRRELDMREREVNADVELKGAQTKNTQQQQQETYYRTLMAVYEELERQKNIEMKGVQIGKEKMSTSEIEENIKKIMQETKLSTAQTAKTSEEAFKHEVENRPLKNRGVGTGWAWLKKIQELMPGLLIPFNIGRK